MIKIIFLADTHLGFDYPIRPKKDRRRRGPDFFNNFNIVLQYAVEKKVDLVIHGGDLFFRTKIPKPIIDLVYFKLLEFAEHNIPTIIVPGNHESSRLPDSLLLQHPTICVFKEPQFFSFNINGLKLNIAGFPCVRKNVKNEFVEILNHLELETTNSAVNLLCMHQSIEGATVGPSDYTFRYGDDVIPLKDIPEKYQLILSGHIHRQQILYTSKKNIPIIYPGSIERTAFAEKDEVKGFYEIRIRDKNNIEYDFISLPTRPMIDLIFKDVIYSSKDIIKEMNFKVSSLPKDSIVRIKFLHPGNINLLNSILLEQIFPKTMNYQIAGLNFSNTKK